MSGAALHSSVASGFAREIGRAREGRQPWPRLQRDLLERALKPNEAEIVIALAAAHGGAGRMAGPAAVRLQIARGRWTEQGDYDLASGAWLLGDQAGRGLLAFAAAIWTKPGAPVEPEQAGERLCALLGRAVVAALVAP